MMQLSSSCSSQNMRWRQAASCLLRRLRQLLTRRSWESLGDGWCLCLRDWAAQSLIPGKPAVYSVPPHLLFTD